MGLILNDLSTLILFKFAIKAVSSLQERQESISLIILLSVYHPDLRHSSCNHTKKKRNKRWLVYYDLQNVNLTTALPLARIQTLKGCHATIYQDGPARHYSLGKGLRPCRTVDRRSPTPGI